jgi:DNA-binding protein Fis
VAVFFDALGAAMDRLPANRLADPTKNKPYWKTLHEQQDHRRMRARQAWRLFPRPAGTEPGGMYDMLVRAVEKPLAGSGDGAGEHNQSRAAEWLGLNRNTLRKKLVEHSCCYFLTSLERFHSNSPRPPP